MTKTPIGRLQIMMLAWVLLGSAILLALPQEQALEWVIENGPVENLSVVVISMGVVFAGLGLFRQPSRLWLSVFGVVLWMYLRELDYQTLFTPRSVESIGLYSNPNVSLTLKLTAVAIMAPFGLAGLSLLALGVKCLRAKPYSCPEWLCPIIMAVGMAVVALCSEKLLPHRFQVVEEFVELSFETMLVAVIACYVFGIVKTNSGYVVQVSDTKAAPAGQLASAARL